MSFEDDTSFAPPEEHVVALHDFASSNSTCLSFLAGQVIKVFNRDSSGWWDGELNGQRGWFPSNYVDQESIIVESTNGDVEIYEDGQSDSQHHEGSYSHRGPWRDGQDEYSHTAQPSRSPTPTSGPLIDSGDAGVLDPILHAIALLHNAARANRIAHFQPSTACVISSVRSVLSATDCLTRESPVLKAHSVLAKERKAILSELSRLVTQARKASAPMVDETGRVEQMDSMLKMADLVLANVRRFLDVAVECGVAVPNRRSSVYDDLYSDDKRTIGAPSNHLHKYGIDRSEQDKTPTPDSPRSSGQPTAHALPGHLSPRGTKSFGDVRSKALAQAQAQARAHGFIHQADDEETNETRKESARSRSHDALVNGGKPGNRERCDSSSDSPDSGSACDSMSRSGSVESFEEPVDTGPVERTPQEVLQRLSLANDQLLSIIAAFIGHVHTHTPESHASSYAHLIDMTREAVDGVRNLLLVVEAVNNNEYLQAERPRETSILWETRESLYEATTALVTAARVITSAPGAPSQAGSAEDDDKSRLLQAATGVLRTGGECVGAVRLCIEKTDSFLRITLSEPSGSQKYNRSSHEEDATALDEGDTDGKASASGLRRGKHTLSFLGRKATSLSCLREKYEKDGYMNDFDQIAESEWDEEEESDSAGPRESLSDEKTVQQGDILEPKKQVSPTERNETRYKPKSSRSILWGDGVSSPLQARRAPSRADGDHSDFTGSEPMSRDNSRTSGSTMHSSRSEFTADTSTRSSLDHEAVNPTPIGGKFTKDSARNAQRKISEHSAELAPRSGTSAPGASSALLETMGTEVKANRLRSGTLPSLPHGAPLMSGSLPPDYDQSDIIHNSEGQVTGATLAVLVEKMTPHDTMIDSTFSTSFFLCFRLFTSPLELLDAVMERYNLQPPEGVQLGEEELSKWNEHKVLPVRLRIINFLKSWLESHWHGPTDHAALDRLIEFSRQAQSGPLSRAAMRLTELAQKRKTNGSHKTMVLVGNQRGPGSLQRVISSEWARNGALQMMESNHMYAASAFSRGGPVPPTPNITKGLLSNLRGDNHSRVSVLDFDPLELARQLTIMESKLYCAIQPEELLGSKFSKKSAINGVGEAIHVKSMSSLSTNITGWISECILGESDARKRTQLVKFFIKLGDRCEQLNNFHTLMAIQCALNSSTISRLKKTWDGLPSKYRGMMEHQRRAIEHTRNYAGYRARLRNTSPPALPFLGLFLTDLTFCHEGNAATRPCPSQPEKKLLNFDKYVKMSRIIGEFQKYQVPYTLMEVPEIQSFLQSLLANVRTGGGGLAADDLYRRSLLLEPRSGESSNGGGGGSVAMRAGGGDGKLGLDLFNWRAEKF
ncbi:ras GEF [Violaceomyces palustris]|uniref:Ras GEF n=1 Tax=Violaceomyces palustris TaxID=1673888 RepID=A0ACD0P071_9BASI|nr:ras GEF [Violaceomyces palustris]